MWVTQQVVIVIEKVHFHEYLFFGVCVPLSSIVYYILLEDLASASEQESRNALAAIQCGHVHYKNRTVSLTLTCKIFFLLLADLIEFQL